MPSVSLTYDSARGWIGSADGAANVPFLFDGNTAFTSGVHLGNGTLGSSQQTVPMWNAFYLQTPVLPAGAFPTSLQTTWYIQQSQSWVETVYVQAFPQPYAAGEARISAGGQALNGGYPANFSAWNAAWPLDNLEIQVLASAQTFVSEVVAVLYYALAPTPASVRVSPVVNGQVQTTVRPTALWSYVAGDGGGDQSRFRVKWFTSSQAAVAGFNPEVSAATWDSGEIASVASSYTIPINLANSTTYKVYVKVAQVAGGQTQWSGWSSATFTINIPPAAVPARPTITATADSANARIALSVSQSTTPSWDHVIVERSNDNGATWVGVRNGHAAITAGATLAIWDYESGNGEPVVYRAQAELTSVVGGITQVSVSQWSVPTAAVSWSSAFSWLKSPLFPTLNLQVRPTGVTTLRRPARRGVFAIAGRTNPIVVSDVRGGRTGTLSFTTLSATEADAVEALLMLGGALLYQPAPAWRSPTFYLSPGDLDEVPPADDLAYAGRYWSFDATEVDAPLGDAIMPVVVTPPVTGVTYLLDESGNRLTDENGNELTA